MNYGTDWVESFADSLRDELCFSIEDDRFDQVWPLRLRKLSPLHWTPIVVASHASKLLVTKPGTRVLDIGCGPGKFCLIAAALTDGYFTGVEQRRDLAKAAKDAALKHRLNNIEIIHGNVTELSFSGYDAFYLFNPFEENVSKRSSIARAVPVSGNLYIRYIKYVAAELRARPIGTRVVTYAGCAHEVPSCYDCQLSVFGGDLKLWVKVREAIPNDAQFAAIRYRSRRIATNRAFSELGKSPIEDARPAQRV